MMKQAARAISFALILVIAQPAHALEGVDVDETMITLGASIRFGGGQRTSRQLDFQTVAGSFSLRSSMPLGGMRWDSQQGWSPTFMGASLRASGLNADADGETKNAKWPYWVAGSVAVALILGYAVSEAFKDSIENFGPEPGDDDEPEESCDVLDVLTGC